VRIPDGAYGLRRTGGLLPPLGLVRKEVAGAAGATIVAGRVRLPFRLQDRGDHVLLVYRGPLGVLRDRLRSRGDGSWDGEATVAGRRYGRFTMTPRAPSPPAVPRSAPTPPPS
jgi:hypothetical protein